jgi:hypothetical protein
MTARVLMIVFTIAVAVGQTVMPALAGGPADNPSCLVINSPGGATVLRGTVSASVQDASTSGDTNIDFTLRLERGGALGFFRASLFTQAFARSNEGILCTLLDESTNAGAVSLRAAILSAFGLPSGARFWLTTKSLSKAEIQGDVGQWFCNNTYTDPTLLAGSCTPQRAGSMADVILYVN